MVPHPEHEHVAVERRPVLLPDDQHAMWLRQRMRPAARHEILVVENPVVLVGHLLVDDVLIFGLGHHHQVLQRVVEVAGVVHMNVRRAAVPSQVGELRDLFQPHRRRDGLPGFDVDLDPLGRVLEALHDVQRDPARRELHAEHAGRVEDAIADAAHTRVGIRRHVRLAVRRFQMDARSRLRIRAIVQHARREHAHGPLPPAIRDANGSLLAAVRLQQRELGQPAFVRDVGNPLAVGRPARMKGVVVEERHLVRLATIGRLDVEVVVLVGRAGRRRVDEPLAVDRHVGARPIERLFGPHDFALVEALRVRRDAVDVARTQRDGLVRHDQELLAVGHPGRRDMEVEVPKVEAILAERVVRRDGHGRARPPSVLDRPHVYVEVPARRGRHVGHLRAIG